MDGWTRWTSSPHGFRGSPAFLSFVGAVFLAFVGHGCVTGQVKVGKGSRGQIVHRAEQPTLFLALEGLMAAVACGLIGTALYRARAR